jgi:predicted transcriptional regulator
MKHTFLVDTKIGSGIAEREEQPMSKRTMTLNLSDEEMDVLETLSAKKDLSKTVLLRQALRLYQRVEERLERGDKLFFEDEAKQQKAEIMML